MRAQMANWPAAWIGSIPSGVFVPSGRLERFPSGAPSAVAPAPPSAMDHDEERSLSLGTEVSASVPPPSPLTGCYLLIVVGEPHTHEHKEIILQRLVKGLLSWDSGEHQVDLEKELATLTAQAPEGEEARYGERLIQFASENLVTEILIHPQMNTLMQCMRNLLSSFTRHRHLVHAGYTFAGNGSWIMQDGTFSLSDFTDAYQENEVQRVIRAYENSISIDIHCSTSGGGEWAKLPDMPFVKHCKIRVNPNDILDSGSQAIKDFTAYVEPFIVPASLEQLLVSSDVVGNIRFSHPTLYVFPGGQGDAALFGINGFNMLVDGGFSRKACWWDFARHLDRLDAVLFTRLNNCSASGMAAVLHRKAAAPVYPQIGHFFCNLEDRRVLASPDGDKDADPLLVSLVQQGSDMMADLRHLNLKPQYCYRSPEPINLYHKVGHGTLDMYVLNPSKDSKYVREFLKRWHSSEQKLFEGAGVSGQFNFPIPNLVSICALLVWRPANPDDTITRLMFPGSTPQHKIFEGLEKLKQLDFLQTPTCCGRQIDQRAVPVPSKTTVSSTKIRYAKVSKEKSAVSEKSKDEKIVELEAPLSKIVKDETDSKNVLDNKLLSELVEGDDRKIESVLQEALTGRVETKLEDKITNYESTISDKKKDVRKKEKSIEKKLKDNMVKTTEIKKTESEVKSKTDTKKKTEYKSKTEMTSSVTRNKVSHRTTQKSLEKKDTSITTDKKNVSDDKKTPPTTPKKSADIKLLSATLPSTVRVKMKSRKLSPGSTSAKSTKEAANRRVVESKYKQVSPKRDATQKTLNKTESKPKREPISRRPKPLASPIKGLKTIKSPSKSIKSIKIDPKLKGIQRVNYEDILKDAKKCEEDTSKSIDDIKQQELDDKEEQEIVREIEAVFNRDNEAEEKLEYVGRSDIEKITCMLEEAKNVTTADGEFEEEYLIIEKEEVGQYTEYSIADRESSHDLEELQKHIKDKEESEKKMGDKSESKTEKTEEDKTKLKEVVQLEIKRPDSKEQSVSVEEKQDLSSEKKTSDSKNGIGKPKDSLELNIVYESHHDEKISTTIESGATTAPTLPEDERIPLDKIKEDQQIDEKHVGDDIKEVTEPQNLKDVMKPTSFENGSKLDTLPAPIREIVKTPDEVADLPLHEEVDYRPYEEKKTPEDDMFRRKPDVGFIHEIKVPKDLPLLDHKESASYKDIQNVLVFKTADRPSHAELVTVTPGSAPESPMYPGQIKITTSGKDLKPVKECKEDFDYRQFTEKLRETHITTVDSPIKEDIVVIEESILGMPEKIPSIPEDVEKEIEEAQKLEDLGKPALSPVDVERIVVDVAEVLKSDKSLIEIMAEKSPTMHRKSPEVFAKMDVVSSSTMDATKMLIDMKPEEKNQAPKSKDKKTDVDDIHKTVSPVRSINSDDISDASNNTVLSEETRLKPKLKEKKFAHQVESKLKTDFMENEKQTINVLQEATEIENNSDITQTIESQSNVTEPVRKLSVTMDTAKTLEKLEEKMADLKKREEAFSQRLLHDRKSIPSLEVDLIDHKETVTVIKEQKSPISTKSLPITDIKEQKKLESTQNKDTFVLNIDLSNKEDEKIYEKKTTSMMNKLLGKFDEKISVAKEFLTESLSSKEGKVYKDETRLEKTHEISNIKSLDSTVSGKVDTKSSSLVSSHSPDVRVVSPSQAPLTLPLSPVQLLNKSDEKAASPSPSLDKLDDKAESPLSSDAKGVSLVPVLAKHDDKSESSLHSPSELEERAVSPVFSADLKQQGATQPSNEYASPMKPDVKEARPHDKEESLIKAVEESNALPNKKPESPTCSPSKQDESIGSPTPSLGQDASPATKSVSPTQSLGEDAKPPKNEDVTPTKLDDKAIGPLISKDLDSSQPEHYAKALSPTLLLDKEESPGVPDSKSVSRTPKEDIKGEEESSAKVDNKVFSPATSKNVEESLMEYDKKRVSPTLILGKDAISYRVDEKGENVTPIVLDDKKSSQAISKDLEKSGAEHDHKESSPTPSLGKDDSPAISNAKLVSLTPSLDKEAVPSKEDVKGEDVTPTKSGDKAISSPMSKDLEASLKEHDEKRVSMMLPLDKGELPAIPDAKSVSPITLSEDAISSKKYAKGEDESSAKLDDTAISLPILKDLEASATEQDKKVISLTPSQGEDKPPAKPDTTSVSPTESSGEYAIPSTKDFIGRAISPTKLDDKTIGPLISKDLESSPADHDAKAVSPTIPLDKDESPAIPDSKSVSPSPQGLDSRPYKEVTKGEEESPSKVDNKVISPEISKNLKASLVEHDEREVSPTLILGKDAISSRVDEKGENVTPVILDDKETSQAISKDLEVSRAELDQKESITTPSLDKDDSPAISNAKLVSITLSLDKDAISSKEGVKGEDLTPTKSEDKAIISPMSKDLEATLIEKGVCPMLPLDKDKSPSIPDVKSVSPITLGEDAVSSEEDAKGEDESSAKLDERAISIPILKDLEASPTEQDKKAVSSPPSLSKDEPPAKPDAKSVSPTQSSGEYALPLKLNLKNEDVTTTKLDDREINPLIPKYLEASSAEHDTKAVSPTLPLDKDESIAETDAKSVSPTLSLGKYAIPSKDDAEGKTPDKVDDKVISQLILKDLAASLSEHDEEKTGSPTPSLNKNESPAVPDSKSVSDALQSKHLRLSKEETKGEEKSPAKVGDKVISPAISKNLEASLMVNDAKGVSLTPLLGKDETPAVPGAKSVSPTPSKEDTKSEVKTPDKEDDKAISPLILKDLAASLVEHDRIAVNATPPLDKDESSVVPDSKSVSPIPHGIGSRPLKENTKSAEESPAKVNEKVISPVISKDLEASPAEQEEKAGSPTPSLGKDDSSAITESKLVSPTTSPGKDTIPSKEDTTGEDVISTKSDDKAISPPISKDLEASVIENNEKGVSPTPPLDKHESPSVPDAKSVNSIPLGKDAIPTKEDAKSEDENHARFEDEAMSPPMSKDFQASLAEQDENRVSQTPSLGKDESLSKRDEKSVGLKLLGSTDTELSKEDAKGVEKSPANEEEEVLSPAISKDFGASLADQDKKTGSSTPSLGEDDSSAIPDAKLVSPEPSLGKDTIPSKEDIIGEDVTPTKSDDKAISPPVSKDLEASVIEHDEKGVSPTPPLDKHESPSVPDAKSVNLITLKKDAIPTEEDARSKYETYAKLDDEAISPSTSKDLDASLAEQDEKADSQTQSLGKDTIPSKENATGEDVTPIKSDEKAVSPPMSKDLEASVIEHDEKGVSPTAPLDKHESPSVPDAKSVNSIPLGKDAIPTEEDARSEDKTHAKLEDETISLPILKDFQASLAEQDENRVSQTPSLGKDESSIKRDKKSVGLKLLGSLDTEPSKEDAKGVKKSPAKEEEEVLSPAISQDLGALPADQDKKAGSSKPSLGEDDSSAIPDAKLVSPEPSLGKDTIPSKEDTTGEDVTPTKSDDKAISPPVSKDLEASVIEHDEKGVSPTPPLDKHESPSVPDAKSVNSIPLGKDAIPTEEDARSEDETHAKFEDEAISPPMFKDFQASLAEQDENRVSQTPSLGKDESLIKCDEKSVGLKLLGSTDTEPSKEDAKGVEKSPVNEEEEVLSPAISKDFGASPADQDKKAGSPTPSLGEDDSSAIPDAKLVSPEPSLGQDTIPSKEDTTGEDVTPTKSDDKAISPPVSKDLKASVIEHDEKGVSPTPPLDKHESPSIPDAKSVNSIPLGKDAIPTEEDARSEDETHAKFEDEAISPPMLKDFQASLAEQDENRVSQTPSLGKDESLIKRDEKSIGLKLLGSTDTESSKEDAKGVEKSPANEEEEVLSPAISKDFGASPADQDKKAGSSTPSLGEDDSSAIPDAKLVSPEPSLGQDTIPSKEDTTGEDVTPTKSDDKAISPPVSKDLKASVIKHDEKGVSPTPPLDKHESPSVPDAKSVNSIPLGKDAIPTEEDARSEDETHAKFEDEAISPPMLKDFQASLAEQDENKVSQTPSLGKDESLIKRDEKSIGLKLLGSTDTEPSKEDAKGEEKSPVNEEEEVLSPAISKDFGASPADQDKKAGSSTPSLGEDDSSAIPDAKLVSPEPSLGKDTIPSKEDTTGEDVTPTKSDDKAISPPVSKDLKASVIEHDEKGVSPTPPLDKHESPSVPDAKSVNSIPLGKDAIPTEGDARSEDETHAKFEDEAISPPMLKDFQASLAEQDENRVSQTPSLGKAESLIKRDEKSIGLKLLGSSDTEPSEEDAKGVEKSPANEEEEVLSPAISKDLGASPADQDKKAGSSTPSLGEDDSSAIPDAKLVSPEPSLGQDTIPLKEDTTGEDVTPTKSDDKAISPPVSKDLKASVIEHDEKGVSPTPPLDKHESPSVPDAKSVNSIPLGKDAIPTEEDARSEDETHAKFEDEAISPPMLKDFQASLAEQDENRVSQTPSLGKDESLIKRDEKSVGLKLLGSTDTEPSKEDAKGVEKSPANEEEEVLSPAISKDFGASPADQDKKAGSSTPSLGEDDSSAIPDAKLVSPEPCLGKDTIPSKEDTTGEDVTPTKLDDKAISPPMSKDLEASVIEHDEKGVSPTPPLDKHESPSLPDAKSVNSIPLGKDAIPTEEDARSEDETHAKFEDEAISPPILKDFQASLAEEDENRVSQTPSLGKDESPIKRDEKSVGLNLLGCTNTVPSKKDAKGEKKSPANEEEEEVISRAISKDLGASPADRDEKSGSSTSSLAKDDLSALPDPKLVSPIPSLGKDAIPSKEVANGEAVTPTKSDDKAISQPTSKDLEALLARDEKAVSQTPSLGKAESPVIPNAKSEEPKLLGSDTEPSKEDAKGEEQSPAKVSDKVISPAISKDFEALAADQGKKAGSPTPSLVKVEPSAIPGAELVSPTPLSKDEVSKIKDAKGEDETPATLVVVAGEAIRPSMLNDLETACVEHDDKGGSSTPSLGRDELPVILDANLVSQIPSLGKDVIPSIKETMRNDEALAKLNDKAISPPILKNFETSLTRLNEEAVSPITSLGQDKKSSKNDAKGKDESPAKRDAKSASPTPLEKDAIPFKEDAKGEDESPTKLDDKAIRPLISKDLEALPTERDAKTVSPTLPLNKDKPPAVSDAKTLSPTLSLGKDAIPSKDAIAENERFAKLDDKAIILPILKDLAASPAELDERTVSLTPSLGQDESSTIPDAKSITSTPLGKNAIPYKKDAKDKDKSPIKVDDRVISPTISKDLEVSQADRDEKASSLIPLLGKDESPAIPDAKSISLTPLDENAITTEEDEKGENETSTKLHGEAASPLMSKDLEASRTEHGEKAGSLTPPLHKDKSPAIPYAKLVSSTSLEKDAIPSKEEAKNEDESRAKLDVKAISPLLSKYLEESPADHDPEAVSPTPSLGEDVSPTILKVKSVSPTSLGKDAIPSKEDAKAEDETPAKLDDKAISPGDKKVISPTPSLDRNESRTMPDAKSISRLESPGKDAITSKEGVKDEHVIPTKIDEKAISPPFLKDLEAPPTEHNEKAVSSTQLMGKHEPPATLNLKLVSPTPLGKYAQPSKGDRKGEDDSPAKLDDEAISLLISKNLKASHAEHENCKYESPAKLVSPTPSQINDVSPAEHDINVVSPTILLGKDASTSKTDKEAVSPTHLPSAPDEKAVSPTPPLDKVASISRQDKKIVSPISFAAKPDKKAINSKQPSNKDSSPDQLEPKAVSPTPSETIPYEKAVSSALISAKPEKKAGSPSSSLSEDVPPTKADEEAYSLTPLLVKDATSDKLVNHKSKELTIEKHVEKAISLSSSLTEDDSIDQPVDKSVGPTPTQGMDASPAQVDEKVLSLELVLNIEASPSKLDAKVVNPTDSIIKDSSIEGHDEKADSFSKSLNKDASPAQSEEKAVSLSFLHGINETPANADGKSVSLTLSQGKHTSSEKIDQEAQVGLLPSQDTVTSPAKLDAKLVSPTTLRRKKELPAKPFEEAVSPTLPLKEDSLSSDENAARLSPSTEEYESLVNPDIKTVSPTPSLRQNLSFVKLDEKAVNPISPKEIDLSAEKCDEKLISSNSSLYDHIITDKLSPNKFEEKAGSQTSVKPEREKDSLSLSQDNDLSLAKSNEKEVSSKPLLSDDAVHFKIDEKIDVSVPSLAKNLSPTQYDDRTVSQEVISSKRLSPDINLKTILKVEDELPFRTCKETESPKSDENADNSTSSQKNDLSLDITTNNKIFTKTNTTKEIETLPKQDENYVDEKESDDKIKLQPNQSHTITNGAINNSKTDSCGKVESEIDSKSFCQDFDVALKRELVETVIQPQSQTQLKNKQPSLSNSSMNRLKNEDNLNIDMKNGLGENRDHAIIKRSTTDNKETVQKFSSILTVDSGITKDSLIYSPPQGSSSEDVSREVSLEEKYSFESTEKSYQKSTVKSFYDSTNCGEKIQSVNNITQDDLMIANNKGTLQSTSGSNNVLTDEELKRSKTIYAESGSPKEEIHHSEASDSGVQSILTDIDLGLSSDDRTIAQSIKESSINLMESIHKAFSDETVQQGIKTEGLESLVPSLEFDRASTPPTVPVSPLPKTPSSFQDIKQTEGVQSEVTHDKLDVAEETITKIVYVGDDVLTQKISTSTEKVPKTTKHVDVDGDTDLVSLMHNMGKIKTETDTVTKVIKEGESVVTQTITTVTTKEIISREDGTPQNVKTTIETTTLSKGSDGSAVTTTDTQTLLSECSSSLRSTSQMDMYAKDTKIDKHYLDTEDKSESETSSQTRETFKNLVDIESSIEGSLVKSLYITDEDDENVEDTVIDTDVSKRIIRENNMDVIETITTVTKKETLNTEDNKKVIRTTVETSTAKEHPDGLKYVNKSVKVKTEEITLDYHKNFDEILDGFVICSEPEENVTTTIEEIKDGEFIITRSIVTRVIKTKYADINRIPKKIKIVTIVTITDNYPDGSSRTKEETSSQLSEIVTDDILQPLELDGYYVDEKTMEVNKQEHTNIINGKNVLQVITTTITKEILTKNDSLNKKLKTTIETVTETVFPDEQTEIKKDVKVTISDYEVQLLQKSFEGFKEIGEPKEGTTTKTEPLIINGINIKRKTTVSTNIQEYYNTTLSTKRTKTTVTTYVEDEYPDQSIISSTNEKVSIYDQTCGSAISLEEESTPTHETTLDTLEGFDSVGAPSEETETKTEFVTENKEFEPDEKKTVDGTVTKTSEKISKSVESSKIPVEDFYYSESYENDSEIIEGVEEESDVKSQVIHQGSIAVQRTVTTKTKNETLTSTDKNIKRVRTTVETITIDEYPDGLTETTRDVKITLSEIQRTSDSNLQAALQEFHSTGKIKTSVDKSSNVLTVNGNQVTQTITTHTTKEELKNSQTHEIAVKTVTEIITENEKEDGSVETTKDIRTQITYLPLGTGLNDWSPIELENNEKHSMSQDEKPEIRELPLEIKSSSKQKKQISPIGETTTETETFTNLIKEGDIDITQTITVVTTKEVISPEKVKVTKETTTVSKGSDGITKTSKSTKTTISECKEEFEESVDTGESEKSYSKHSSRTGDMRSSSAASDEIDHQGISSPPSDISSRGSRAATNIWGTESGMYYSDDDGPGSPSSTKSQIAHSPRSNLSFELDTAKPQQREIKEEISHDIYETHDSDSSNLPKDPMSTSIYGEFLENIVDLPSMDTDRNTELHDTDKSISKLTESFLSHEKNISKQISKSSDATFLTEADEHFEKAIEEHKKVSGSNVISNITAKYELNTHSQTGASEQTSSKQETTLTLKDLKSESKKITETMSSCGSSEQKSKSESVQHSTTSHLGTTKDPIESWGKPLGLPSPVLPPTQSDGKGTPKKQVPSAVLNKNKINQEKSREAKSRVAESPNKKKTPAPVYLELTYVPHHGNSYYSAVEFFKRVRARYYVFSGTEPSKEIYNALLDAKKTWEEKDLEVTIIPTYDTDVLGYWVTENEEALEKYKIDLSPSASRCTINLQDHETSCAAYRLEF